MVITATGFLLTDEVEKNKYALMLSEEDRLYLERVEGITDFSRQTDKKKNVCKYMSFKFTLVCKCLTEPKLVRVYTYMIL